MKGRYFGEKIENLNGWHGKPMLDNLDLSTISKLIKNNDVKGVVTLP